VRWWSLHCVINFSWRRMWQRLDAILVHVSPRFQKILGNLLCDGMCHFHDTCNTEGWMSFGRDLGPDLTYPLFGCSGMFCNWRFSPSSPAKVAWYSSLGFWRSTTIRIDVVNMLWVVVVWSVFTVLCWSWGFVMFRDLVTQASENEGPPTC
jgi:hypothetical protein